MLGASLPRLAGFHLVFGHAPDFALHAAPADLLVAGHTHGGQVRLPVIGPLLTFSRVPRAWASGVTRLGHDRTLVVSRGIGLERGHAPRLRFLCRPELVFLRLTPLGPEP
jgi:predicted MPP superfamily phosphohydrolase